jgi:hypothetical protein
VDYGNGLNPTALAAADFNGDGQLDVLSGLHNGPFLQLGNGDGTFRQGQ